MRQKQRVFSLFLLSPSSRRAWIEIQPVRHKRHHTGQVALLAEGVDRNLNNLVLCWRKCNVALLAEGVDRNKSG